MTSIPTRRDFLRVAGLVSLASFAYPLSRLTQGVFQPGERPNIIIVLFDALSARHLGLYGYRRQNSPNLERFAQRATVYHRHHSAANFTTPSTASLFTGVYPFTHRVFAHNWMIANEIRQHNLLTCLQPVYVEAAQVQNIFADLLLYQMRERIEAHPRRALYSLTGYTFYDGLFRNDPGFSANIYDQFLFDPPANPGAIFTSLPFNLYRQAQKRIAEDAWRDAYPAGLPFMGEEALFVPEQVIDGAFDMLRELRTPFFSYLHFLPPHWPYRRSNEFVDIFQDGWEPCEKEIHPLSQKWPDRLLSEQCREYDEFIAQVDSEFGRLVERLEASGLLENSYVIFTSDHGELFERGETGHDTPLLYEGVTHIPLLIRAPGQTQRKDVHALTSNVDLFPSLAALSGMPEPETLEGQYLPGLGLPEPPEGRSTWIVEAKLNPARAPLTKASVALLRWPYKLISYFGYQEKFKTEDRFEFYNLENDPEELENLADSHPVAADMRLEMNERLVQVNAQ
jgi:arylsulfatase A-like enzyme